MDLSAPLALKSSSWESHWFNEVHQCPLPHLSLLSLACLWWPGCGCCVCSAVHSHSHRRTEGVHASPPLDLVSLLCLSVACDFYCCPVLFIFDSWSEVKVRPEGCFILALAICLGLGLFVLNIMLVFLPWAVDQLRELAYVVFFFFMNYVPLEKNNKPLPYSQCSANHICNMLCCLACFSFCFHPRKDFSASGWVTHPLCQDWAYALIVRESDLADSLLNDLG